MFKLLVTIIALSIFSVGVSSAEPKKSEASHDYGNYNLELCQSRQFVEDYYIKSSGYVITQRSLNYDDLMIEIFENPVTLEWIIFISDTDNLTCWITGGEIPFDSITPEKPESH